MAPEAPPLEEHRVRPKAIILDVNGTLFPPEAAAGAFEELGLPASSIKAWFASTLRDAFATQASGGGSGGKFVTFAQIGAAHLGDMLRSAGSSGADPQAAMKLVAAAWRGARMFADIPPALRRLKDAGIQVCALTNGSADAIARGLVENAGLEGVVAPLLDVGMAQAWKPDTRAYRYATKQLGVEPREALMAASHPWDINGALAAGLRGVYVARSASPGAAGAEAYPDYLRRPEAVVADFAELAERVLALPPAGA